MMLLPSPIYFFVCIYIDYNEQEALFKEKGQEKEEDSSRGASGWLYTAARDKLFYISSRMPWGNDKYSLIKQMMKALEYDARTATSIKPKSLVVRDLSHWSTVALFTKS